MAASPTRSPTGSSASARRPRTCTQEAFISIWRSGARFDRTRGSVRSLALSIVRNRAIDSLRSKAGKAPKLTFDDDAILEQRPAEELTENEAMRHETASEVRGALEQLPGDQSKVIELAYFGGFSQSEIARMLDVPLGTVKGRMRLGLEKIRGRAGGGTGMSDEHDNLLRGHPGLHAGRPRPRGGAGAGAPRRGLRTLPHGAALADAGGAGAAGNGRARDAAAGSCASG